MLPDQSQGGALLPPLPQQAATAGRSAQDEYEQGTSQDYAVHRQDVRHQEQPGTSER